MLESFGLPESGQADERIYLPQGSLNTWQTWNKPRGAKLIYMVAISGGGGGGGGFTRIAGAAGGGGGGGGTGAMARLWGPALMFPDVLYVQPGVGGLGSTGSGVAGTNGGLSYVVIGPYPAGTAANMLVNTQIYLKSAAGVNTAGGAGTGAAAGAAGGGASTASITEQRLGGYSMHWEASPGLVGFIGGAQTGAVGASVTNVLSAGIPLSGGAGGAGTTSADFAGGNVTGVGIIQTISGGNGANVNGGGGYTSWSPFMTTGGAGGASRNAAAGGRGGDGGIGSGGGGGGAGTTGGAGGRGGDGVVMIISI